MMWVAWPRPTTVIIFCSVTTDLIVSEVCEPYNVQCTVVIDIIGDMLFIFAVLVV